jgi:predicted phage terminase large subunit-like protein
VTPDEERYLLALKRRKAALSARDDLLSFAKFMMPKQDAHEDPDQSEYMVAKHHRVIAAALEEVEKGNIRRLIINLGPRHGKSQLTSRLFPAWYLGRNPANSIMLGTYNQDFANDFGRDVRAILDDPVYKQIFDARLKDGAASVDRLELEQKGKLFFVGVGGSATGRGCTLLTIDDPIKSRDDADSPTKREKLWNWFNQSMKTRLLSHTGAIVLIQCMTGDTPVLMADGHEKQLKDVRPGDKVATYRGGRLSTSVVEKWANSGRDCIFTITTKSAKTVRANGRHPFLVCENGVQKWIRTKDLRRGHAMLRVNGENGRAQVALQTDATSLSSAGDIANHITTKNGGLTAFARLLSTLNRAVTRISNTVTEYLSKNSTDFSMHKGGFALCASNPLVKMSERIGAENFASTIATTPARFAVFSAMTATLLSDMQGQQTSQPQSLDTSDFILDEIVDIRETGVEEVFDVQIAETENFIANGLVSHNTRWHEDDLVGRLTDKLNPSYSASEAKKWKIIDLPALAKDGDVLGREEGEALWPEKFPSTYLHELREADPRGFQALYQGSPTPEKGNFFAADRIKVYSKPTDRPPMDELRFYIASDHAVSLKQERDKSCLLPVGLDRDNNLWVMDDVVWGRYPTDEIVEKMIDLMAKYKPLLWWAEKGHISKSIGPFLRKRMLERSVFATVNEIVPVLDKKSRAQAISGRIAMGMVYFPSYAPWYAEARDQMMKFPYASHDDFVDALSYIGLGLALQAPVKNPKNKPDAAKGMTYGWLKADTKRRERERQTQYGGF